MSSRSSDLFSGCDFYVCSMNSAHRVVARTAGQNFEASVIYWPALSQHVQPTRRRMNDLGVIWIMAAPDTLELAAL